MAVGSVDATVARLTARTLLGRRRALLLLVLPVLLLGLAILLRVLVDEASRDEVTVGLVAGLGVITLLPLLSLIAGTGAIGPEIDDGSIVYLLAKPLNRHRLALTKLVVAVLVVLVFGALPVLVSGLVLSGSSGDLAVGIAAAAALAGVAYCAVFLVLAVVTRNAVVVGLIYALVWESLVGSLVPGAQALSIQQWAFSLTRSMVGESRSDELGITSAVSLGTGMTLLAVVSVAAAFLAGNRLRSLRLTSDD
jgi:ABC-2 type transport system permease protein